MSVNLKFPSVCIDCTNRRVGCHGSCGPYNESKKEYSAKKNDLDKKQQMYREVARYYIDTAARNSRKD